MKPVVTVVPISVVMTPSPVAWRPSIISRSAPIPRAMDVVRTIGNRERDRAWIGAIARVSGITGSVRTITSVIRSVSRITSIIIISASASSESHKKQKEE